MTIKQKLALNSSIITIVALGVILTVISVVIYQNAKKDATNNISLLADNISLEVRANLSGPLSEAYILKRILEEGNILDRTEVFKTLNVLTETNPSILGTYVVFEPNAFDGNDKRFANTPYHDKTGRFIPYSVKTGGSIIIEPVVDYELPESNFYQLPKKTMKAEIIPPFDYKVDGKDVTMISLVYPVIRNQKFLGISGADISMETIRNYLFNLKILDGLVKTTLVANNGYLVFDGLNPNSSLVEWKNDLDPKIFETIKTGTKQIYNDGEYLYISVPIQLVKDGEHWALRIAYPISLITEKISFIFWLSLSLGLLGILFSTFANVILFKRMVDQRLTKVISFTNEVANGNLKTSLNDHANDEIGNLVKAIRKMTANISHILQVAQGSGTDLTETAKVMESTILELSDLAQSQAASSEEASATVEELNASSETISGNVDIAVANTKSIHDSLQNIQDLVSNITKEIESFGNIAILANDRAEEGRNMAGFTSKAIEEIQEKSQSITEFSEVISTISEKTSLLALNAAIEAARAGESGRGFAVVAEEISKLASQAAESVSQINQLSSEAMESIENGGSQVQKLIEVLREITKEVSVIFDKSKSIVPLIQDQKIRTDQIYAEITEITDLVFAIQQSTEEQKRATVELANMTVNISNGSQVLSDQSSQMTENSMKMSSISTKLGDLLQKFQL
ncbi:methyl-accepting chemotaxis protein [Leptospira sp. 96542]|nr:methyl-accepting chemotaxis protein [Leptospira sp. 96542]